MEILRTRPKVPVHTGPWVVVLVEVAGFEPACSGDRLGLLRAQPTIGSVGGFDAWRDAGGQIEVPATWEEIFRVTEPPSGWGKTPVDGDRCQYTRDQQITARGATSVCVSCRADRAGRGLAGFWQRLDARPLFGRTVKLTAMIRSEDVSRAAYLWVAVEDPEGRIIARVRSEDNPLHGTQDWHALEVSGIVPPDVGKLVIGLSLEGWGRVWLDDLRFVALEERGLPALSVAIANPSFEDLDGTLPAVWWFNPGPEYSSDATQSHDGAQDRSRSSTPTAAAAVTPGRARADQ